MPGWPSCKISRKTIVNKIADIPPLLLPRPARITVGNARVFVPSPKFSACSSGLQPYISISVDSSIPHSQGYRLTISTTTPHIRIAYRTSTGLQYAHATLSQLCAQYGNMLPELDILDYPAITTRGVLLDVSRNRIPTMAELATRIPAFAALKLNHLQLYTEHTFAYQNHADIWRGYSALTHDEITRLNQICLACAIDLAANQNCFGHMTRWLSHPKYAHLAETHGTWLFDGMPRSGPFSLCPIDPGSIRLIHKLLDEIFPCFSSAYANIGCDETYDVGQGRSYNAVASRGKSAIYYEYLQRVCRIVRKHEKHPMFWADFAISHPASIDCIDPDAVALVWGYEAEYDFRLACERLARKNKTAWVCPGTSSWRSFSGRSSTKHRNILHAATSAAQYNLPGFMITDWGDAGHQQVWPISWIAIAEAAERAWNAGRNESPVDHRALSLHCFGDSSLFAASWIDTLGDIDVRLRSQAGRSWYEGKGKPLQNASVHYADWAEPWGSDAIALSAHDFMPMLDKIDDLRSSLCTLSAPNIQNIPAYSQPSLLTDELSHTLDRVEFAYRRAIARRGAIPDKSNDCRASTSLADLAEHIMADHDRLWKIRSRVGGMNESRQHDEKCKIYV